MYLLVSTLIDDGNSVLNLNVEKIFVSDNLTNLDEDELEQNIGYKLIQTFNQYIFALRFHPEKRNEKIENDFISILSKIPLDIYVVKELIEIVFSNNLNLNDTKKSVRAFLYNLFPNLMNSLEFVIEDSYDNTISFECSLVEDETMESNSHIICGYTIDYGGRGADDDFSILKPIVIKGSPLVNKLIELLAEEDMIDYTWFEEFEENYGKIEELNEIYEEPQYYDAICLQEFTLY